jgi:hypothetical protein
MFGGPEVAETHDKSSHYRLFSTVPKPHLIIVEAAFKNSTLIYQDDTQVSKMFVHNATQNSS